MSDNADLANDIMELALQASIQKCLQKPLITNTDPWCERCGEEIPALRREKLPWVSTCVECQSATEVTYVDLLLER